MADIETEIAAYTKMQPELESKHTGKWVVFQSGSLVGLYESFEMAAAAATKKFGRGPYLIRQVGASGILLPASVMFKPVYA